MHDNILKARHVSPLPGLFEAVFHDAQQAISATLDALLIDTAYAYNDGQKLELAAPDPLMWRALIGRWGREAPHSPTHTPRHGKGLPKHILKGLR